MNVFEHTTHGTYAQYLPFTYIMLVRVRIMLGSNYQISIFNLASESKGQMKW